MELCPGEDESQLATTEVAVHDLQIVDPDLGFFFGMASMEVREAVIVEEHDDGDSKETADRRHASIMPTAPAARAQTKHFAFAVPWVNPTPSAFPSASGSRCTFAFLVASGDEPNGGEGSPNDGAQRALADTIVSLKGIVSIVMGLALTHSIVTLVAGEPITGAADRASSTLALGQVPLQSVICALAVITAIVRFYHGNNQHVDFVYSRASAQRRIRGRAPRGGIGVDFLVIMVQSVLFAVMSFYVDGSRELLLLFMVLLYFDIVWYITSSTITIDSDVLEHQRRWMLNNIGFLAIISILYFQGDASWTVTAGAVAILLNTVVDFWISWGFYFPGFAKPEQLDEP